jgi:hypothetical protein
MLSRLVHARSPARVALTAALAAALMSGCGGDDDATTQSRSVSTAAGAAAPASAAKPAGRNCPVTAGEVSQQLGLEIRAARPVSPTKVSCAFRRKADCPCGPTKYTDVEIVVAAGMPETVSAQRDDYLRGVGIPPNDDPFTDRPDLGKDAFMVKPQGLRGRYATFPSTAGAAVVSVTFGVQDAANRAWVAEDMRVADRVISFVAPRMS